jgi:alpha-tubulin suppressor-like RCC1 family protein
MVAGGGGHSLALLEDGTLWSWGRNDRGQLGHGTTQSVTAPVKIEYLSDVATVSCGYFHTLAALADGTAWAWGNNDSGQLGDGETTNLDRPHQIEGLNGVVSIDGGGGRNEFGPGGHSVAALADGTVFACGLNDSGQLGDGTTTDSGQPVQVKGLTGVKTVIAAGAFSLALAASPSAAS